MASRTEVETVRAFNRFYTRRMGLTRGGYAKQSLAEARVVGARLRRPALDPGGSLHRRPFFGIPSIPSLPWGGNALVLYDTGPLRTVGGTLFGTPPAPTANTIQTRGVDPHALTAFGPQAAAQISEFLELDGAFVDTCGGQPCHAAGWTGP